MNTTIANPLLPDLSLVCCQAAQYVRKPYEWALSAICAAGDFAMTAMQKKDTAAKAEEEVSLLQTSVTEFEPAKPFSLAMPQESVELSKIVSHPQLRAVVTNLLQCKAFRTSWGQMLQEGTFQIRYATSSDIMHTEAMTCDDRTIVLKKNMSPDDLVCAILFELGNLPHAKNLPWPQDCATADAFAVSMEDLEYETWLFAHYLSSQLHAEGFLSEVSYQYLTKEEYLARMEESGHTDSYRADWYRECDPKAGEAWAIAKYPEETD